MEHSIITTTYTVTLLGPHLTFDGDITWQCK